MARNHFKIAFFVLFSILPSGSFAAHESPPMAEIRSILSTQSRFLDSGSIDSLTAENLETRLPSIDPFAEYTAPHIYIPPPPLPSIGIDIFPYLSFIWARSIPGGPADRAGLPEIGTLLAVNGKNIQEPELTQTSRLITEAIATGRVSLSISNGDSHADTKTFTLSPERYTPPSVTWRRHASYVVFSIREFIAHDTAHSLSAIYDTVVTQNMQVIIDLRRCTGGDLFEAVSIAGMFISPGHPLIRSIDRSETIKVYRSPDGKKYPAPVAIIMDDQTASSAEILAGILQYYGPTILIGKKSYGKCESQTIAPLSNGGSLKFTNLSIRFPDNSSCTKTGLAPDIPIAEITILTQEKIIHQYESSQKKRSKTPSPAKPGA